MLTAHRTLGSYIRNFLPAPQRCLAQVEIVFRNAEVICVDLLAAHIKFCHFWPKYLNGVLRGLTVRQPLGAYIRTSPSSSHQRCLHAAHACS